MAMELGRKGQLTSLLTGLPEGLLLAQPPQSAVGLEEQDLHHHDHNRCSSQL